MARSTSQNRCFATFIERYRDNPAGAGDCIQLLAADESIAAIGFDVVETLASG